MKSVLFTLIFTGLWLSGFGQSFHVTGEFVPGHYYQPDGTKVTGLLRHTYGSTLGDSPDNFLDFKKTEADKFTRLTVYNIHHFVMGQDSFTVKRNFDVHELDRYELDFVQVQKTGEINLYLHYSTRNKQKVQTYLVERHEELYKMVKPANVTDQLTILVSENKPLLAKLRKQDYTLEHLPTIVEEFNTWHAQRPKAKEVGK